MAYGSIQEILQNLNTNPVEGDRINYAVRSAWKELNPNEDISKNFGNLQRQFYYGLKGMEGDTRYSEFAQMPWVQTAAKQLLQGATPSLPEGYVGPTDYKGNPISSMPTTPYTTANEDAIIGKRRIVDTRPGSPTLGLLVPDYTAISPERMQNEKKITLPSLDLTSKDGVYNSIIAGATGNLFTPTSTETKQQSILDQMASLVSEGTQKGADQLAMEKAAGIETLNTQLSDISNQIKAKALEFEAFKQAQQGKPITMSSITGSIAEQQSKIASDVLLLQAQGEILQGKLTNAQNNINRAIDLKYSTIENKYKIYQAQLEALKPTLDREERQRAAILEQQKLVEQRKYEEAKQAEKDKKSLIMDYIGKYGDAGITLNDSLETAQAKLKTSKIYQDQIRGPVGPSSLTTKTYWTAPDTLGNIKYYYGIKGNSAKSQEITSENYLKGKSSSEGVLTETSPQQAIEKLKEQGYTQAEVEDMNKYPNNVIENVFNPQGQGNKPWWKFW